jgi:NAD(P)-dependent dehydrogenase (short-subunit alcohol dehydrogenase family)
LALGGAIVVACGIEQSANEEMARAAGSSGLALQVECCDVTDPDAVRSVIGKTVSCFGGLDIIVNAAAIHPFGTVLETSLPDWNRCMMVNVGSIYLLAHLAVPEMRKRGAESSSISHPFKDRHASGELRPTPHQREQFAV